MTTLFNYDPYFDDFDEDKNFMRVLFRPGYAVQARELTQLQTILSNQIEKFGNHIFQSGSPITGGKISLDNRSNYLILQPQYESADINLESFLDKTIISYNSTKNVRAKVIAVDNTSETTPTLILKYLSGDRFTEDDELKILGQNIFAKARSTNAVGSSYVASIQDGVYYFKGQFVKVLPQFLVLELFYKVGYNSPNINSKPSWKVGIEFTDTIVDEIDDSSLLDPAQGSFNYQAPGAHRYQLQTTLSKRTLDSSDESSFFEVIRLVNGVKTKEINYPIYNELEKTMARRTYDESGNYTVDPFILTMEEGDSSNGKFNIILDPGKAYVGGYEYQTISSTKIELDRARDTKYVDEYDLPTNYTSYVVLNTVRGTLDIPSFTKLDVHCVDTANVNVSTDVAYNSTKIGTLNASMIKYDTASDDNIGNTHTFTVNVFNSTGTAINGTVRTGSTNTVINLPTSFSVDASANAYANMYFRLTDSSLSSIKILESDSSGLTITLSSALPFSPTSANTFSIESDFKVAQSLVERSAQSILFAGNVDDKSKETSTGFSFINEPKRSSLIFDVPFDSIKEDTITNFDFFARKLFDNKVSDGSGLISISTTGTDTFAFAGTPGVLSDSTVLNNIICFVRADSVSNGTSGIAPNTVLSLANSYFSVTAVDTDTITIDVGTVGVRADFIITTKVNNAELGTSGAIRGKQLIPLVSGADLHAKVPYELDISGDTLDVANSVNKTVVSGTGIVFDDIGATFLDNPSILTDLRTPGVSVSLQVPDIYELVRITESKSVGSNVTTSMLTSDSYDITDYFEFDNGQRKTHYDHASIKLKRGYRSPTGNVLVQYKYLKHQSAPSPQNIGLFTVDSYLKSGSNFTYDDISVFNNTQDSKVVSLRSAFDFRPTRQIGGTELSGAVNPDPDLTASLSFDHYLARIDRVVVKPSKSIAIISGTSAVNPSAPVVPDDDMLIYTLKLPAYTETVTSIESEFKNNRRFTMRDIGNFDTRIKNLEYYVSLNALEKDTTTLKILDTNGLDRSKYGILVDNFTTTSQQATYTEVGFDNRCLIEKSELKPASLMRTIKLQLVKSLSSGNYKVVGSGEKTSLMMNYTSSNFANQLKATKATVVAGALFGNFSGASKLFPEYSAIVDTDVTAQTVYNPLNGYSEFLDFYNTNNKILANGSDVWTEGKNSPYAKIPTDHWYTEISATDTSSGVLLNESGYVQNFGDITTSTTNTYLTTNYALQQDQIGVSTSKIDLGSYVTDIDIQPYMKPLEIVFVCNSLRPNTGFFVYFDNIPVSVNALQGGYLGLYSTVANPNKAIIDTTSGIFDRTEKVFIANSSVQLSTYVANYASGNTDYKIITLTDREPNSNTFFIVNKSYAGSISGKYIQGLESGAKGTITSVTEHKSGLVSATTPTTITLSADAPSVNIAGNTISFVADTGDDTGYGHLFQVIDYNTTSKVATVIPRGDSTPDEYVATGDWLYSIGKPKSNRYGQVSGSFFPRKQLFRNGERKLRVTESFNNSFDSDSISFTDSTFVCSGVSIQKTDLVSTVYNIGIEPKIVGFTSDTQLYGSSTSDVITNRTSVDNTPPPPQPALPPAPPIEVAVPITQSVAPEVVQWVYEDLGNQASSVYGWVESPAQIWGDLGTQESSVYGWIDNPAYTSQFDWGGCPGDPLAQTFYVDPTVYPYGIFLDSLDLFFRTKDSDGMSVRVEIRPTVNATPHAYFWYPESVVEKYPDDINTSENPSINDSTTITNFKFFTPVFLGPGMHCVVIKTDSPEYAIWTAEKGAISLSGETVSINPYVGTLYKSQNAMEYTPLINEDLMFNIKRCVFDINTATFYLKSPNQPATTYFDSFRVSEKTIQPISSGITSIAHSFVSTPIGSTIETSYRPISPGVKYDMGGDDLYPIGYRRKELETVGDFTLKIDISTLNDAVSPVISTESLYLNAWENFVDNCSISAEDFNIIVDGSGYSNANTIVVNSDTGSGADIRMIVDGANGNVVGVNVISGGSGYTDDYTISISDTTDPSSNITANATIVLNSEFDESGGPADARYITKAITLADGFDAGDLRVILNGNIPGDSDIIVFYKVLSSSDDTPFKERKYQKMERVDQNVIPSKTTKDFMEFEYRPSLTENQVTYVSENGVTYDTFKTFSIKIVLTSSDPAIIPKVRDLRIIALPAE